ncbi:MAG: hypothetical protein C0524_20775 [Rhodobacter sp.]|nr:hypothetical protein [Rhodobacter sp.]
MAGLFGAFLVGGIFPILLCIAIGWWIGKRIAYWKLSVRSLTIAVALICLIVGVFWYPAISASIEARGDISAWDYLVTIRNALTFAFLPAAVSAALSWVLNYDEALQRRAKAKDGPDI